MGAPRCARWHACPPRRRGRPAGVCRGSEASSLAASIPLPLALVLEAPAEDLTTAGIPDWRAGRSNLAPGGVRGGVSPERRELPARVEDGVAVPVPVLHVPEQRAAVDQPFDRRGDDQDRPAVLALDRGERPERRRLG